MSIDVHPPFSNGGPAT